MRDTQYINGTTERIAVSTETTAVPVSKSRAAQSTANLLSGLVPWN